ncbi:MAG: DUF2752 domain-containing protein [Flavisolibacter sp.]
MSIRLFKILIVFIAAVSVSLLYFYYPATDHKFYPDCALYSLTNLFCPACGSQRAFSELLHGHFLSAAQNNLLFVLFLFLTLTFFLRYLWIISTNKTFQFKIPPRYLWMMLAFIISFWIIRNIPFEPFSFLAPTGS